MYKAKVGEKMEVDPIMCRLDVMVGGHVLDACIDSGAIFSLMSELAFNKVKEHCGPVEHPEVLLIITLAWQMSMSEIRLSNSLWQM